MASINGIQIKSLKQFRGHEGEPLFQGNVYYKGKLLGFWSQDAHGGICDNYSFSEYILKDEVKKYVASDRVEEMYRSVASLENLLADLVDLTEREKEFKKFVKKGYPTMLWVTDDYHIFCGACMAISDEAVLNAFKDEIEDFKKKMYKNCELKISIYRDLKDFVITV